MGLYKRKNVWWMAITYQGKQIRRSTETANKKLAESVLAKVKVRIIEGKFFDVLEEKDRTFEEMMNRYMVEQEKKKALSSHIRDRGSLGHLLPFFGEKVLSEITPKMIARYKAKRRQEEAAPATINKELGLMRHAFNIGIREWEWCRENPVARIAMEPVYNQVDHWLSEEKETKLLRASPQWLREIIIFALNTGMRRGEILALRWDDVDLACGTLVVMKSKNRERRTIPLNKSVFELLMSKQARTPKHNPVFSTSKGTLLIGRNLMRSYYIALEKAEIQDFRFHDLRHTFATRLVQRGVDIYKVQRLLGHKTPAMTQRYAHHSPESLRDGVEVLDGQRKKLSQFYHNEMHLR